MSSTIQSSKRLTTIGSMLLLFPALNIVGIFLVLIGMKGLSEYYKDHRIYHNAILGVLFGIIGFIMITLSSIVTLLIFIYPPSDTIIAPSVTYAPIIFRALFSFIFILLMSVFFKKAFKVLTNCSGIRLFRTVGNLLLTGATMPVAFISGIFLLYVSNLEIVKYYTYNGGLGGAISFAALLISIVSFILVYLAFILMAVAFSSLKPRQPNQPTMTKAFCPYCGTSIAPDATFCPQCGKQT